MNKLSVFLLTTFENFFLMIDIDAFLCSIDSSDGLLYFGPVRGFFSFGALANTDPLASWDRQYWGFGKHLLLSRVDDKGTRHLSDIP